MSKTRFVVAGCLALAMSLFGAHSTASAVNVPLTPYHPSHQAIYLGDESEIVLSNGVEVVFHDLSICEDATGVRVNASFTAPLDLRDQWQPYLPYEFAVTGELSCRVKGQRIVIDSGQLTFGISPASGEAKIHELSQSFDAWWDYANGYW